jgi:hypothetical protein
MIHNILAINADVIAPIIMLVAYVFIISLVIICLIRISRYFISASKEQKLIRMELGKVAEEVHLLRQELKEGKVSNPSSKSD